MKGRERKVREKGGHKLKKCSEDAAVFLFCWCDTNHDWKVALTQSDIKVKLTLYCLCAELIYIQLLLLNLEVLGFFLHETAHQVPKEGTWVITRCVVRLYIRKKYKVSVYLWGLGVDVDIYWVLDSSWFYGVFFIGLFGVFFMQHQVLLMGILKCLTLC